MSNEERDRPLKITGGDLHFFLAGFPKILFQLYQRLKTTSFYAIKIRQIMHANPLEIYPG